MASNTSPLSEAIFCTDFLAEDNNKLRHKSAECGQGQRFCSSDQEAGVLDAATKLLQKVVPLILCRATIKGDRQNKKKKTEIHHEKF